MQCARELSPQLGCCGPVVKIVLKLLAAFAGVIATSSVVFIEELCVLGKRTVSLSTNNITALASAVSTAERVSWRTVLYLCCIIM